MKKLIGSALLSAAVMTGVMGAALRDYAPGKLPAAKNVKFAMEGDVLSMTFGPGNEAGSRAWMRQYHPFITPGKALHITMQVKTTDMDPEAKVGFMVQAMGENHKYLRSRLYMETFPAADFNGEWKTMEYYFRMPDPAKTTNWKDGVELMITFEAHALQGKAEFKDFKAEVTDAPPLLADYEPGKLPAAKNVKFAVKNNVCSMTFGPGNGMGSRAWMRRYHDMLKPGQKLRISMMVKTTDMLDPRAQVGFLVQALGEGRKYLAAKPFIAYFPAGDYDGEWKEMVYEFVMPDLNKTANWKNAAELMITFEALAQEGKAEFKDFKAEVLAD